MPACSQGQWEFWAAPSAVPLLPTLGQSHKSSAWSLHLSAEHPIKKSVPKFKKKFTTALHATEYHNTNSCRIEHKRTCGVHFVNSILKNESTQIHNQDYWRHLYLLTSSVCCGSCMTNSLTMEGLNSTRYEKMSVAAALTCRSSIPLTREKQYADMRPSWVFRHTLISPQWSQRTMTISRAGKMPRLARVLKNASLFCGCRVCENAQNSLTKFTWES